MDLFMLLVIFFLGTVIGSFLGVIIDRLPRGESIAFGRSHCDHCRRKLGPWDLIPVVSFIMLGAKCRYCKKSLTWLHPLIEILTGILFVIAAILVGSSWLAVSFLFFIIAILVLIFFIDLRFGLIPLPIILPAIIITLLWQQSVSDGVLLNTLLSALGAGVFFLGLFLITRGRGMGFGDVLYVLFMGLLLGFPKIILGLYIAFLSGAVISIVLVIIKHKKLHGGTVPFGPFLVFGTIISLFWGQRLIDLLLSYILY